MFTVMIATTGAQLRTQWATYVVREARDASVIYVGHCPLSHFFDLPDLRRNHAFDRAMPIIVGIDSVHPNRADAEKRRAQLVTHHSRPRLNSAEAMKRHLGVKCVTTGETFLTAAQCAAAHRITASALSNHLNNKVGFLTVGGNVYERVK
jgi:hypothetical protein